MLIMTNDIYLHPLRSLDPAQAHHYMQQHVVPLYLQSFPPDERREVERWEQLAHTVPRFELLLITPTPQLTDQMPLGFVTRWHLQHACYVEHFAIHPEQRGCGFGGGVLSLLMAQAQGSPLVLEVEPPTLHPMAARRIGFYTRMGMQLQSFDYQQPRYDVPGAYAMPLMLMANQSLGVEQLSAIAQEIATRVYYHPV